MSGSRHHILPRFLLKGFASRIQGEEVFTWVYRKGDRPFETNTKNVSVEKHFYGKAGEANADDEITGLESDFARLVDELRREHSGTLLNDSEVSRLIAHLVIRTKHLRESFRHSTEYLLDRVTEHLSDFENFKKLLLSNPTLIREELNKVLKDIPAPQWQKDMLLLLMDDIAPEFFEQNKEMLQTLLEGLVAEAKKVMPKAVKDGHIKTLAKNPVVEVRADEYGRLKWFVCDTECPVILGDIACLFEIDGERRFKPVDDKGDKIVNIFLPISAHRLLIGTNFNSAPQIDWKAHNRAVARCSYEYFVSSESSSDKVSLSGSIGTWSGILNSKELEKLSDEIIRDIQLGTLK